MVWTCDEDWKKCMEYRVEGRIPVQEMEKDGECYEEDVMDIDRIHSRALS